MYLVSLLNIIIYNIIKWRKLHITTLNYTLDYTLYSKLFECTFYTLNYDPCYISHHDIKFIVNLNAKIWHHVKILNCSSS